VIIPSDTVEEVREGAGGRTSGPGWGRRWAQIRPELGPELERDPAVGADKDDCHFDSRLGLVYPVSRLNYTGKDWYNRTDPVA
jgi:hypothetical protein